MHTLFTKQFPVLLAPMAGVTDVPFRVLCKRMGADLAFTEMISAKGLLYQNARTAELLDTVPEERPVGVQLFGSDPTVLAEMAARVSDTHADEIALIDLNMGCPAPKITKTGEGSALMRTPALAARIIAAVVKATPLPVTVKFRKGWDDASCNAVEFAKMCAGEGAAAICIHGRTRAQQYSGKADWGCIRAVKEAVSIPVWGNGDVFSAADALRMRAETGCDGVMVARGAQGNPFVFREIAAALRGEYCPQASAAERVETALQHARMQLAYMGEHGILEMRKHLAWYMRGLRGASKLRGQLFQVQTIEDVEHLLCGMLENTAHEQ